MAEPATHCTYTAAGTAARKVSLPPATPDYKATYTATINTNRGAIVIDLLNSKATCTVNSFVHLAEAAFYNKSPCFRLSTSDPYMLQCGDPTGKGSGGPGYGFANENLTGATYPAGTVAMANAVRRGGQQRQPVLPGVQGLAATARLHTVWQDRQRA